MNFKPIKPLIQFQILLIPSVIFVLAIYSNGAVFFGDSLQYLKMAFKVSNGNLPITDKWMPLYSILLAATKYLTQLDFIQSAAIINALIFSLVSFLIYKLNQRFFSGNLVFLIISMSFFILNNQLITFGITIMAELLMLLFYILFFTILFSKTKQASLSNKDVLFLSLIILMAVFTKYNGLILVIILLTAIILEHKPKKFVSQLVIIIGVVLLPYFIWGRIKADDDLIVMIGSKNTFFSNVLINLKDLFTTCIEFYLPLFPNKFIDPITSFNQSLIGLLIVIALIIGIILEYVHRKQKFGFFLLLFVLLYIISFIYLSSTSDINEVNQRTMIYPLLMFNLYLLYFIYNINNKELKIFFTVCLSLLILIGLLKTQETISSLINKKVGVFNKPYYLNTNQTKDNAITLIHKLNLNSNQIHTNENKLLPISFNFELMCVLPTNDSWKGNKIIKKDCSAIKKEIQELKTLILIDSHIVVFFGTNYRHEYNKYYKEYFSDSTNFNVIFYNDGFIISKK